MLLFPDPITHAAQLSGACFLYFEEPLLLTIPPQVITPDAFGVFDLIQAMSPPWQNAYVTVLDVWQKQKRGCTVTLDLLKPLRDRGYCSSIMLAYPANFEALENVDQLLAAAGLHIDTAEHIIDYNCACSELVRHIHLERYLELGKDVEKLYNYCDEVFQPEVLRKLLIRSYFFRPSASGMLKGTGLKSMMLTNERLMELLGRLPVEQENPQDKKPDLLDVAGWEIFRRLISPQLDPLTLDDVSLIIEIREGRRDEIKKLKSRCVSMAEEVDLAASGSAIVAQIDKLVRTKAAPEIAQLLQLDEKALHELLKEVFSDETTWLACSAALGGLLAGQVSLTAGGAIAALSNLGAKAFKAASERREKLRENDFTLIYTLTRRP